MYAKDNYDIITQSKLKTFRESPEAYQKLYVDMTVEQKETSATKLGTLFHKWVEIGDNAHEGLELAEVARQRGCYLNFTETKCYKNLIQLAKWQSIENGGLFPLHAEGYESEVKLTADYRGMKLGGTIDLVDPVNHIIEDVKTSADRAFTLDRKRIKQSYIEGYKFQAAFYSFLYYLNYGEFPEYYINYFVKPTPAYPSGSYLRVKIDMVLISHYLPTEGHTGQIKELLDQLYIYQHEGLTPVVQDLDGTGHIGPSKYGLLKSSIQKNPYILQDYDG